MKTGMKKWFTRGNFKTNRNPGLEYSITSNLDKDIMATLKRTGIKELGCFNIQMELATLESL